MTCLITWSCYATHITFHPHEPVMHWRRTHCRYPPFVLDRRCREHVLDAILEHCRTSDYSLLAVHVRETHVHLVVSHTDNPYRLCAALKCHTARRLRQTASVPEGRPVWADYRNIRRLPTRESILNALEYVVEKQGRPMALWRIPSTAFL
jgi:REP element-mobilizing transposase RayT